MSDVEIWKDIAGYEGLYQVSNLGRVKSMQHFLVDSIGRRQNISERILCQNKQKDNYFSVILSKKGKVKAYKIHRLVLGTFFPIKNMKSLEVNHKDFNTSNNNLNNLEWATRKENIAYKLKHDRQPKGELHGKAKLTENNIKWIRANYNSHNKKFDANALAIKFKVHKSTIHKIIRYAIWKHI